MARTYRLTPATRLINRLFAGLIKAGIACSASELDAGSVSCDLARSAG